ncbi:CYTH domain-containing protein [Anaeromicropila populeti]|uniref:CYTH domain-containing protein n=1 Tax=Anaeromicropila populeti TaxID=37658 RepID=A0A1I6IP24_9FIRM|nr:CYTH domain-containing protein [Anaeromicropila populeti]SFR68401.1 CYTH domain-containing protein [Anaeromicropila populeti]
MEIERKFLVKTLPEKLEQYEKKEIEQGYLCTNPTVRIRKCNEEYILTYKSRFGIPESLERTAKVCNEVEVPLNEEGYWHLKAKVDDHMVYKTRYLVPIADELKAEVDVFHGNLDGLLLVEVEFKEEEAANQFSIPSWFGEDVSLDKRFTNVYLSKVENILLLNLTLV